MIRLSGGFKHILVASTIFLFGCGAPVVPSSPVLSSTPSVTPIVPFSSPTAAPGKVTSPTKNASVQVNQPTSTPGPHRYDDVDSLAILKALFPAYEFTPNGDMFVVNNDPSWEMWVNARAEGHFTDLGGFELAVIVANEYSAETAQQNNGNPPWGSFLAVFNRNGSLQVIHRGFLFPTSISPFSFDVNIERVVDYDHDDQDDLFITTTATRLGLTTKAGFLYQWVDQSFIEIWSASLGEDNTAALNQPQYYSSSSDVRFSDIDGIGIDSIIVDTTRVDYAHGAQGLADQDHEEGRRVERRVFRWNGKSYSPDSAKATPMPPLPSPTP